MCVDILDIHFQRKGISSLESEYYIVNCMGDWASISAWDITLVSLFINSQIRMEQESTIDLESLRFSTDFDSDHPPISSLVSSYHTYTAYGKT